MTDQISRLGIEIDTRQTVRATKDLDNFQRATDRTADQVTRLQAMAAGLFAVIGSGLAVGQIIRWGDAWTSATNQLRLATNSTRELAAAQKEVYDIAQRTASRLEGTAGLFSSIQRAAGEAIGSQKEVLRLTETISKLAAASGGPEGSRNSALFQLRQALGGAVLQAQEFNSLIDGAPLVVDAIAKGFGKTRSEMKKLVNDGQADIPSVIRALQKYGAEADKIFGKTQFTVGDALVRFDNAMQKLVGTNLGPLLKGLSDAVSLLAENMDKVVKVAAIAGVTLAVAFAPTIALGIVKMAEAVFSLVGNIGFMLASGGALKGLMAGLSSVAETAALAVSGLTAALLSNPITAIAVAITAATAALFAFGDQMKIVSQLKFFDTTEEFGEFTSVLGTVEVTVKDVMDAIGSIIGEAMGGLWSVITDTLGAIGGAIAQWTEKTFGPEWAQKIGRFFSNALNGLKAMFQVFVASLVAIWQTGEDALGGNLDIAGNFAKHFADAMPKIEAAMNTIGGKAAEMAGAIAGVGEQVWDKAVEIAEKRAREAAVAAQRERLAQGAAAAAAAAKVSEALQKEIDKYDELFTAARRAAAVAEGVLSSGGTLDDLNDQLDLLDQTEQLLKSFPKLYALAGEGARAKAEADAKSLIALDKQERAVGQLLTMQKDMVRGDRLADALVISIDEYEILQKTFDLLDQYPELYRQSGEAAEQVARADAERFQNVEKLSERLKQQAERARDIAEAPWRNFETEVTRINDDFWTAFSEKGFKAFDDLGDMVKNLFKQLEADILRSWFEPMRRQILEVFGLPQSGAGGASGLMAIMGGGRGGNQQGGVTGTAVAAQAAMNVAQFMPDQRGQSSGAGGGLGSIMSIPGIGKLKLPPGVSSALQSVAAAYVAHDLTTTIMESVGILKNRQNAQIGGAIGGTIGAFIGGPIGSAIGSAAGSLFGGLFGPKPSNAWATANIGANGQMVGSLTGKDPSPETQQAVMGVVQAVQNGYSAIQKLGGTLSTRIDNVEIGVRDASYIRMNNGQVLRTAVGDPGAAANEGLRAVLGNAHFANGTLENLSYAMLNAGKDFDTIVTTLDKVNAAISSQDEALSQWQASLKNLHDVFDPLISETQGFGDAANQLQSALDGAVSKLRGNFNQSIDDAIKGIEAPVALQFEQMLKAQTDRLKDAAALSADMSKVNKLNGLEIDAFLKNLSANAGAIGDIDAQFQKLIATAQSLGQATAPIEAAFNQAKAGLISGFNKDIADQFGQLNNPTMASLTALLEAQKTRLQQAKDIGGNLVAVERLNALEQQRFFEGLSDDQKNALGDYLGIIESFQGRIAVVLSRLGDELSTRIDDLDGQRQALEDRASTFRGFAEAIGAARQGLADKYSGLTPQAGLEALRARFGSLSEAARGGNESALTALPQLAQQLVEKSRGLYGSTATFRSDFDMVQRVLGEVEGITNATANTAQSQADSLVQQVDLLTQIRDALQNPDPALDFLQKQTSLLDQNNSLIGSLLQSYIDLSNLQAGSGVVDQALLAAAMQRAQDAIAGLNQSLTPSAPAASVSVAATQNAAPGGVQNTTQANGSADGEVGSMLSVVAEILEASAKSNQASQGDLLSELKRIRTQLQANAA